MIHYFDGLEIYRGQCAFSLLRFQHSWEVVASILYRALEVVDGAHVAGEYEEFTLYCGESQFFHSTCAMPDALPTESGIFKKVMLHFQ